MLLMETRKLFLSLPVLMMVEGWNYVLQNSKLLPLGIPNSAFVANLTYMHTLP